MRSSSIQLVSLRKYDKHFEETDKAIADLRALMEVMKEQVKELEGDDASERTIGCPLNPSCVRRRRYAMFFCAPLCLGSGVACGWINEHVGASLGLVRGARVRRRVGRGWCVGVGTLSEAVAFGVHSKGVTHGGVT